MPMFMETASSMQRAVSRRQTDQTSGQWGVPGFSCVTDISIDPGWILLTNWFLYLLTEGYFFWLTTLIPRGRTHGPAGTTLPRTCFPRSGGGLLGSLPRPALPGALGAV